MLILWDNLDGTQSVEHGDCPYLAVVTEGKAWVCTKCGAAGRLCDECNKPVDSMELWQQPVEGGAGLAFGHRACIEAEWGPIRDHAVTITDDILHGAVVCATCGKPVRFDGMKTWEHV